MRSLPSPSSPSLSPPTDDLVAAARAGDGRAWDAIYARHAAGVRRVVARIVRNTAEVDNLVQQTFLDAFRDLGGFRGDAAFGTWLYRIAVHVAYRHLRRRHLTWDALPENLSSADAAVDQTVADRQELSRTLDLIQRLDAKKRIAYVLRVFQGLSYDEIGERVGATEANARQRVKHAERALAAMVERDRLRRSSRARIAVAAATATLALAACSTQSSTQHEEEVAHCSSAHIVVPTYPASSVIVAVKDVVADYGADPTGTADATPAFQQALDDTAALGGGTVWAPAGTYRFDGGLVMPAGVTLHGDWKQPTASDASAAGTVFAIHYAAGPFLSVSAEASLDGATLWYPDQNVREPIPATAIAFVGTADANVTSITIANITLVNPWVGIDTVTYASDPGGNHLFRNIYGSPLHTGLLLRMTASSSRHEENHFGPRYWSDSGLPGAASRPALVPYLQANATAIDYQDNWGAYNVTIDDYATGILFEGRNVDSQVTGQQIVGARDPRREPCDRHRRRQQLLHQQRRTDRDRRHVAGRGVRRTGARPRSLVMQETTVQSRGIAIDNESPQFSLQVVHSSFTSWKGYAIKAIGGDLVLAGGTFAKPASGNKDFSLGVAMGNVIVLSNTFADALTTDRRTRRREIWIDNDRAVLAGDINGFAPSGFGTQLVTARRSRKPARTDASSLSTSRASARRPDCTRPRSTTRARSSAPAPTTPPRSRPRSTPRAPPAAAPCTSRRLRHGRLLRRWPPRVPNGVELLGPPGNRLFRARPTPARAGRRRRQRRRSSSSSSMPACAASASGTRTRTATIRARSDTRSKRTAPATGSSTSSCRMPRTASTSARTAPTATYIDNYSTQGYGSAELYISKSGSGFVGDYQGSGGGGKGGAIDIPTSPLNPPGDLQRQGDPRTPTASPTPRSVRSPIVYASGVGIQLGGAKNELILNAYVHSPHIGLQAIADGAFGGPSFTLVHFGTETFTGVDLEALDPAGARVVLSEYHTIAIDGYPQNGGTPDRRRSVSRDRHRRPTDDAARDLHAREPRVHADRFRSARRHDLHPAATSATSKATARATSRRRSRCAARPLDLRRSRGKFINPLDPGKVIVNDVSPNVALAGVSLASPLSVSGPVDLHMQPPW